MKKQNYFLILFFLGILTVPCLAEVQTISLKDGSQIKGELTGVGGGIYTVHTSTFGDIKVNTSDVASISNGAPPVMQQQAQGGNSYGQASSANDLATKVQAAQTKLMNDPHMMQQLQAMTQDPELMRMLSDPELVRAVTSRDVKAIEANPKAQELMNNPKMRAIMEQMQSSGNY